MLQTTPVYPNQAVYGRSAGGGRLMPEARPFPWRRCRTSRFPYWAAGG